MSAIERMSDAVAEVSDDERVAADELQRGCGYHVKKAKDVAEGKAETWNLYTEHGVKRGFRARRDAARWADEQRLAGWQRAAGKGL